MEYFPTLESLKDRQVVGLDLEIVEKTAKSISLKINFLTCNDQELSCSAKSKLVQLYQSFIQSFSTGINSQRTFYSFRFLTFEWWNSPLSKFKYLSDVSPKDKPWDLHRAAADIVAEIYGSADYERYHERIKNCSTLLEFAKVVDEQAISFKLKSTHFCRHRHCTVCQWRKTLMWTARFLKAIPNILEDYPKHRYILLTLTVRNCRVEELRDTIRKMNKAWERMSQRKIFPSEGFVKSLEVTRNKKDNSAHPHFHILMMVPSGYFGSRGGYLNKDKWIELWKSCLRVNYDPSIDVQAIKSSVSNENLVNSLREVLKYSVKPSDLIEDKSFLLELTNQLHKTRSISLGGIFKKYLSEHEPDDYITENPEEETGVESDERFLFDWKREVKRYARMTNKE